MTFITNIDYEHVMNKRMQGLMRTNESYKATNKHELYMEHEILMPK